MKPKIFAKMFINVVVLSKLSFGMNGMLAVTYFETVGHDLILGECLSVWKESNENPVRLMTGSCALCFINIIVKYAGM